MDTLVQFCSEKNLNVKWIWTFLGILHISAAAMFSKVVIYQPNSKSKTAWIIQYKSTAPHLVTSVWLYICSIIFKICNNPIFDSLDRQLNLHDELSWILITHFDLKPLKLISTLITSVEIFRSHDSQLPQFQRKECLSFSKWQWCW